MKKFYSNSAALCGFALLLGTMVNLSSCSDAEEVMNPSNLSTGPSAPVSVHVSDFSISTEDFAESRTRAVENPSTYKDVQALTLAFYSGTTEVYSTTQLKSDETTFTTFGEFSLTLPLGSYTMVVIARDSLAGDTFTLTSPTLAAFTSEKVRETFSATQVVSITSTAAQDLSIMLNRVVTKLLVESSDGRIDGVAKIRTTYGAGSKSFDPSTGLAVGNTGFVMTNSPKASIGSPIQISSFAFLTTDEQTMDITLDVLDTNDQVLFTKVVNNVPFKRNRKTLLRGPLFTAGATSTFTIETAWLDDVVVNF
ncbi:MAG: hypothetical protein IKY01_10440 [Prevotella sp.]|nr:hypothetical protein [Prevotella sp.]